MSKTATIFNIQRFSIHDGRGIRTTIFFKGCPLACQWCHNPESQSFRPEVLYYEERCRHCGDCAAACPQKNIRLSGGVLTAGDRCAHCGTCAEVCVAEARRVAGRTVTVPELLAEVEKDLVFFDDSAGGVTLSGGEPASQADFAIDFLEACRSRGIHTAIETCGVAGLETFLRLASSADLVFFDLKFIDREAHRLYAGASNTIILRNLKAILDAGIRPVVRIPVVPGINDTAAETGHFAWFLAGLPVQGVELMPFHRVGQDKYRRLGRLCPVAEVQEPSPEEMAHFHDALSSAGVEVSMGGSR
ncbi:MAG TPA: glycyl-radical enzyme activating protein [Verrucomicrobiae bacterium]|nr:glycyl-radical enzyme activating protein [Verrucomicrobiae bacterium]